MGLLWIDVISNPRSILQDARLGKKPVRLVVTHLEADKPHPCSSQGNNIIAGLRRKKTGSLCPWRWGKSLCGGEHGTIPLQAIHPSI
jgi:hypothetical protein